MEWPHKCTNQSSKTRTLENNEFCWYNVCEIQCNGTIPASMEITPASMHLNLHNNDRNMF